MATAQQADEAPDLSEQRSDAELLAATRSGDTSAYGVLYERHIHAAQRLGRILARDSAEADDLVSDSFAKVLANLRAGRGPDLAFRAYLLTTLRNTFYDRTRRDKKVEFTDDMTRHDPGQAFVDTAVAGQERRYAAQAFHRLPERWQMVLWHTEVEGESAAQVAPLLGLSPNGVSALAYRARERLRQMYLQEHIADSPAATCRWTADRLGARVRGGLSDREQSKVDLHLEDCTACKFLYLELTEVNSGIGGVIAGVVLGISAPAYMAGLAVKSAAAAGWFGGVIIGIGDTGRQFVGWVRRIAQQLGTRGQVAIAGGTAAAIIAAIVALSLVANNVPPSEPPPQAQTPAEEQPPPDDSPEDPPDDDSPEDPPADDPAEDPADDPDESEPDDPADDPGEDYSIETDLSGSSLIAGSSGALPVELRSPDSPAQPAVARTESGPAVNASHGVVHRVADPGDKAITLLVDLPDGMTTAGGDAGDGWTCTPDDGLARCTRGSLPAGDSTVAHVPVDVAPEVTGFQGIPVAVTGKEVTGEADLRVPVAPVGMNVGYASQDATGVASAGNSLLGCKPSKLCRYGKADNHTSLMGPYTADAAPSGIDKDLAVSGAHLDIPPGAEVLWAGLHWAASGGDYPGSVQLATPGGGWSELGEQRHWSGFERPVEQSSVDITDFVGGSGEYWIAADPDALPVGPQHYAGWSITAVYRVAGEAAKETAVYEGLAQPRNEDTVSVALPHGGDVDVAYTLWDGDRTLTGDNLDIDGTTIGEPGNLGRGNSDSALEGPDWNTFGTDVGNGSATTGPGGRATVYTGADPLEVGVLALAAPPP